MADAPSRVQAYIDETGIHVPSYPETLEDLKNDFRGIYGDDVYLEPDSQEGAICAVLALRLYDCYTLAASVYSSYSPATAQGVGLSSVVKVNGIRRHAAGYSSVPVRVIGQAGTTICNGIAGDDASRRWLLPAMVVIPVSGEITVTARAEELGEVRAAPGEVKNIVTPTLGWQAVANTQAAVLGAPVEKDSTLRKRQSISTALPSRTVFEGTKGAVASLPGVTRCRGYENDTPEPDDNGIPGHSICMVVEGGSPQAIADAIAAKKTPGCGTFGTTAVETRDIYGVPSIIRYCISGDEDVAVSIRIKPRPGYLAATGETMRENVAEYLNAMDIGEEILHSRLYTPINAAEPQPGRRTFDVLQVSIGKKGEALAAANLAVPFNRAVRCLVSDVELKEF